MCQMREIKVTELKVGDKVDLDSCPYLRGKPIAECEYATVVDIKKETPECVAVTYEGIDQVGYSPDTTLVICSRKTVFAKGNLLVRLDRDEVYPDDPGQGTPAIVEWNGADGQFTATYWCALGEGELLNSRGHVKKLTDTQLEWLDRINREVDEFLNV